MNGINPFEPPVMEIEKFKEASGKVSA